jgi:hypothetical protein
MQRVLHQSIVITLEIVPSGVTKSTVEQATATLADEWLHYIGQQILTSLSVPTYQIFVRQLPLDQGAQIQILLCWIVLQAHRQEISDFNRSV